MDKQPLILLVDDEQEFREIFTTKLKASGFDIAEASSGEEAIQRLQEIKPDLVLLDFNMPQVDGVETLAKIKENPAHQNMKVAFLTNYGEPLPVRELSENDKKFAQQMGAEDYIKKGDDLDEIVKKIKDIIGR